MNTLREKFLKMMLTEIKKINNHSDCPQDTHYCGSVEKETKNIIISLLTGVEVPIPQHRRISDEVLDFYTERLDTYTKEKVSSKLEHTRKS